MITWDSDSLCPRLHQEGRPPGMLRITRNEDAAVTTLRLEGRLAGAWVNECHEAWKALIPELHERSLWLDIRDVTYVDQNGANLLAEIYREHKAEFLTASPLTQEFANQAISACIKHSKLPDRNRSSNNTSS